MEREKAKLSSLIRQGKVLHPQGLKHQQKTISLGDLLSSMWGKAVDLTSKLRQIDNSRQECLEFWESQRSFDFSKIRLPTISNMVNDFDMTLDLIMPVYIFLLNG